MVLDDVRQEVHLPFEIVLQYGSSSGECASQTRTNTKTITKGKPVMTRETKRIFGADFLTGVGADCMSKENPQTNHRCCLVKRMLTGTSCRCWGSLACTPHSPGFSRSKSDIVCH